VVLYKPNYDEFVHYRCSKNAQVEEKIAETSTFLEKQCSEAQAGLSALMGDGRVK
jgi:hypothetical protein